MARRISFPGIEEYAKQINKLSGATLPIINKAVYNGAGVVADTCKENIRNANIAVPDAGHGNEWPAIEAWKEFKKDGKIHNYTLTEKQKRGLINGLGLSTFVNEHGYINTKMGFDGYNEVKTKKYPKGQPNAMIMRTLESGTAALTKQPIVRKSVSQSREKCIDKMQKTLENEIEKIIK